MTASSWENELMTNATPPPMGWYPDPAGSDQERYWDGERWTRNLRNPPDPQPRPGVSHVPETLAPVSRVPSSPRPNAAVSRRGNADRIVVGLTMHETVASIVDGYQTFLATSMRAVNAGASPSDVVTMQSLMKAGFVSDLSNLVGAVIISQAIYQFIMLAACAGSVGQLICGLRVVTLNKGKEHRRLVWWRALIRATVWACVEIGNQAIVLLTPFSYLMPLWQRSRQTIHDAVAGTQVVRPPHQSGVE